jgi:hypothetical protein
MDPHRLDARDLLVDTLARQPVRRDAVVHHPARFGIRVADLDVVAEAPEVIRTREARRAGAHDEHPLAGGRAGRNAPAFLVGEIAQEAIQRVDGDGRVEELAVAGAFARVITRAPVRTGQRVVFHVLPPRRLVLAGLRVRQPRLDVLAGRAGVVAGRKRIDIDGTLPSTRARAPADRFLVGWRQILRDEAHEYSYPVPHRRAVLRHAGRT